MSKKTAKNKPVITNKPIPITRVKAIETSPRHVIIDIADNFTKLCFGLYTIFKNETQTEKNRQEAEDIYWFLNTYVEDIQFNYRLNTGSGDLQFNIAYKEKVATLNNYTIDNLNAIFYEFMQIDFFRNICYEILKNENKKTPNKYRKSGALQDQQLKYNYPKDKTPDLWDNLSSKTIEKIERLNVERSTIVEGIKLTPSETKLLDSLCKLLHNKSENNNALEDNYYTGNKLPVLSIPYGEDKKAIAPRLFFTAYEITKEYVGGEYVSGKDINNVKNIINQLDKKRFLISYKEINWKGKGHARTENKIEEYQHLIRIGQLSQTEYNEENTEISRNEDIIIELNPIFRSQIDSKFILYPEDIIKRTHIAYGSHNVSEIAINLREYLIREHSYKRYKPEITIDRLYYQLAEKWMKEGRKKKVKEYLFKALDMVMNLGLLDSYEEATTISGEAKMIFYLNKDWE
jgi:hypothetical protein